MIKVLHYCIMEYHRCENWLVLIYIFDIYKLFCHAMYNLSPKIFYISVCILTLLLYNMILIDLDFVQS